MKNHQYEDLEGSQIRVLMLHCGRHNDPLSGSLSTVSLDDCPIYCAISYAWGDPSYDYSLQLKEGQIWITKSLDGALRRCRDETKTVSLWADQVCINQTKVQEQGHQVAMMARVYSQAEIVMSWLGESRQSDSMAFWTLHTLAEHLPDIESYDTSWTKRCQELAINTLQDQAYASDATLCCPCCHQDVQLDMENQECSMGRIVRQAVESVQNLV